MQQLHMYRTSTDPIADRDKIMKVLTTEESHMYYAEKQNDMNGF